MASHGYLIFSVQANVRGRRADTRPLDDLDGNGANLLHASARVAHRLLQRGVETISRFEQAYEVDHWSGRGGTLLLEAGAGPFGSAGRTVNIDTRVRREYGDRDANLTPLRALLAIAPGSHFGLLVCERKGARHLKNIVERAVLGPVGAQYRLTFDVANHVDLAAWERFVDNATPIQVTSVWRSTRREDYLPEIRTMPELKMTAVGQVAVRAGGDVLRAVRSKVRGEQPGAINVRALTPRDAEGYDQTRYEITVRDADGTQRQVVVEREQLPQWIYELQDRTVPREAMRQLFATHAGGLLVSDYGATLEQGWELQRWPATLRQQIEVDSDDEPAQPRTPRRRQARG
jgi:hypothetical protein